ncbi:MAG: putative S-layer protein [Firmicutes bacterium]|nr:putative S-layer protein [Bacillota bacterium]
MSLRYVGSRFFFGHRTSTDGQHWQQVSGGSGFVLDMVFGHGRYLWRRTIPAGAGGKMFAGDRAPFSDTAGHWAAQQGYIQSMVSLGAVNGFPDGTFRPDDPVTRAQLIKIVAAVAALKPGAAHTYNDVAESAWYPGRSQRRRPAASSVGARRFPSGPGMPFRQTRP